MSKYTPGPWFVKLDPVLSIVCQEDNPVIAELTDLGESAPEDQIFANASVIAAAPDLFEAATDALAGWKYIRQNHGDLYGVGWDRVEQALEAALKKAAVA